METASAYSASENELQTPATEQTQEGLWASSQLDHVEQLKQQAKELFAELDSEHMKQIATSEEQEFLDALDAEGTNAQAAFDELKGDLTALDKIEERFGTLEHYEEFASFLSSGELSPEEMEAFMAAMENEELSIDVEFAFMEDGLPVNRESFVLFADKFGIPTSTQAHEAMIEYDEESVQKMKDIASRLESIPSETSTELDDFRRQLDELNAIDPQSDEYGLRREELQSYLLGTDLSPSSEWGAIIKIMTDLKEADARNVSEGNPTRYYESFATPMRDFSPEVAQRIEHFEASYQTEAPSDGEPASTLQRAVIESGLPEDAGVSMNGAGEYVARMDDGSEVSVTQDGNHITRSINMDGVDYPLETPIETADFSDALGDFEAVQQNEGSKLQKTQAALSYLENPSFADTPLEDMKASLLQILGHELFGELGIREGTDKQALITTLKQNVGIYKDALKKAKDEFKARAQAAVARVRERYRENDERLRIALNALRNSALGILGVEYLISQIKGNMVVPAIGVPFDTQNMNLAEENFWEPLSVTNNETAHIEYIYRVANKILTGSPDGMVGDKLVGFSIEQAILNPDVAQKTDVELYGLLKDSGVWSETTGTNKQFMLQRLGAPLEHS